MGKNKILLFSKLVDQAPYLNVIFSESGVHFYVRNFKTLFFLNTIFSEVVFTTPNLVLKNN